MFPENLSVLLSYSEILREAMGVSLTNLRSRGPCKTEQVIVDLEGQLLEEIKSGSSSTIAEGAISLIYIENKSKDGCGGKYGE